MLAVAGLTVTAATGTFVTVMVAVPLLPSLVAVTVAEPTATAVMRPLPFTVATAVLLLAQVTARPLSVLPAPSLVVAVSCAVEPTMIVAELGEMVTVATGTGVTVTVAVAVCPSLEALIVALPADTPLLRPLLTIATAALSLAQVMTRPASGFPAESFATAANCCAAPIKIAAVAGDRVTEATGTAVTVTVAESAPDPWLARAFTLYCPGAPGALYLPRCTPVVIVESVTLPALAVQVMPELDVSPEAVRATAVRLVVWFEDTTSVGGEMMTFDAIESSDGRDGMLQAVSTTVTARMTSLMSANRCDSLCLNVIAEFLPKKRAASVVALAARRTWRFQSR